MLGQKGLVGCNDCLAMSHSGQDQGTGGLDATHYFDDKINLGISDNRLRVGSEQSGINSRP